MDGPRFDDLARSVATNRRGVLRLLAGGALGGLFAAVGGARAGAAAKKVPICHRTSSSTQPYTYILVSENPNGPHRNHAGDVIGVDLKTDPNHCGACGRVCDDGDPCTENTCVNGQCAFPAKDCSGQNDACNVGVCQAGTGQCIKQPANEGTTCAPGKACCGGACKTAEGGACAADSDCCGDCTADGLCCASGRSCSPLVGPSPICCQSAGAECNQIGLCCESGKACGSDCCPNATDTCCEGVAGSDFCCASGVCALDQCCTSGKSCGNDCCPNATDTCCEGVAGSDFCCASGVCALDQCCTSGKGCDTECCPNSTDICCGSPSVCCPSGTTCVDGGCQ